MGSWEPSAVVNGSLSGSPHLLTVGVKRELLGCSLVEGCREMEPHSCADAALELLNSEGEVTEQSVLEQHCCSEVACPFSKENIGAVNVVGGCLSSFQDDDLCSVACTSYHSNVECSDALTGCPGISRNCDSSAASLCNAAEMPSFNETGSEDEHAVTTSLVSGKTLQDECGDTELCLVVKHSNDCEDVNHLSDLETDRLHSEVGSKCEDLSGDIAEGCGMPSEVLPMTGPMSTRAQEDDNKSVSGCSAEKSTEVVGERDDVLNEITVGSFKQILPLRGGEIPSKMVGSPSDCGQRREQDTDSVCGPTMERVTVGAEGKDDVPDRLKIDFRTQMFTVEKNTCHSNDGSPRIALYGAVDKLVSVQSSQSSDVNNGSVKFLAEENLLGPHVLCAFNSNSVIDCSAQTDSEGQDNGGFDYVSEAKSTDMIWSSPRRSARISNSGQKTQNKAVLRKGKKPVEDMPHKCGIVDIFLNAARRKRSSFCKAARSSSWGLLENVAQAFEQYNCLDINHVQIKGSRIARAGHKGGKRKKTQVGGSLSRPMVRIHGSTSRIRLKVKVGKEVGQNSLEVIVPKAIDALPSIPATNYRSEPLWGTSADFAEIADGVEDTVQKDVTGIRQLHCFSDNLDMEKTVADASILDVHPADKDTESAVIIDRSAGNADDSYYGISSQFDVEALAGRVDNRYIDSGNSPDSEVINMAPDVQDGSKIQDLHVGTVTSSTNVVVHGDTTTSNFSNCSGKKVKKLDKFPQKAKCIVKEKIPGPSSKSKVKLSIKHGHRGEGGVGLSCSGIVDSLTSKNSSSKTENSKEILPSLGTGFRDCQGDLHVECGTEDGLYSGLGAWAGSSDLQNSEKLLPSFKYKGCKVSKSSKSSKKSKCRSEVLDLSSNRREDACRQTENQRKSGQKNKVKDKGVAKQVFCILGGCPDTGKDLIDDLGKDQAANKVASKDLSNIDMISSGLEKQFCPPRIAWVRCDDCHKWRCIPATLADTIEETNCKWTCKDNMDKAFADCSIPQEKSNAEINAELQISDASGEEDAYDVHLHSKGLDKRHPAVAQQSPWMLIKSNLFLHRSRKKQTIDEIMVCHCKPPRDGRMGCGDACLNRMLNIECVRGTCPCGELCSNQQFQKRKYAKMKSVKCGKKGYGLQSLETISQGTFLIEYVGEVLDLSAYEARQRDYASWGHKHFYFMTLNGSEVIDACGKGNLGRFINHSCDPNCRTEKWMVNGEVCIGLFAVRDIKKGEELTFDYNYVRVFGAAAKKCVCCSSQCRGYIGGDPLNAEVIVQGDSDEEYPEPVMICEDSEAGVGRDNISQTISSHDGAEMKTAEILSKNKDEMEEPADAIVQLDVSCVENGKSTTDVFQVAKLQTVGILFSDSEKLDKHENGAGIGQLNVTIENEDSLSTSASTVLELQNSLEMDSSMGKLVPVVEVSLKAGDPESKSVHNVREEFELEEETSKKSKMPKKLLSSSINCKSDTLEDKRVFSKLDSPYKTSRSSSSVKRGKPSQKVLNASKSQIVTVSDKKGKSTPNGSVNDRLEGVEEKLNELLDADGGISRRKDSPRGYLKLLLLTAASGDRGNSEAIQSARDLSMILDALIKTKSRVVLVDIINKNGLRMLHNIMKQYRREFNKIPVLRKLLKVLEYLGVREILTSEHINGGPPCPGMESFRESILALTEHSDKQVHQIARNFRDRWMHWSYRKFGCMDRDESRMELHKDLNRNRSSASHNSWHDQGVRPTEAIDSVRKSLLATTTSVSHDQESCSISGDGGCSTNETKPRKRKSRWDQPADTNRKLKTQSSLQKLESSSQPEVFGSSLRLSSAPIQSAQDDAKRADDGGSSMHDDVPPGFSSPLISTIDPSKASSATIDLPQQNVSHSKWPFEVVIGCPQRFNFRLPVSYGIPLLTVQQFGTPLAETLDSWVVAPGMPFHPFPPLPREKRDILPTCPREVLGGNFSPSTSQMDQSTPSMSDASIPDANIQDTINQHAFKRMKGSSYDLGRKYHRQQKFNNLKSRPPCWKRNGWRFMGNNSRSGMCNTAMENVASDVRSTYSLEDVSSRMEDSGDTFYRDQQHQNQH